MENKKLVVKMLGDFSLTYDGNPISLERNSTTNATKLLLYLIYHRNEKIKKSVLVDILYSKEDINNPSNNLKVNLFRLRKILASSKLPDNEYITFKSGVYSFNCDIPMEVDVETFCTLANKALYEPSFSSSERVTILQNAISIYTGPFLPMLPNTPWVVMENLKYKELYMKCMFAFRDLIYENGNLFLLLNACDAASEIYPFSEDIFLMKTKCLIDMKRYFEALDYYEETNKMFFEELGICPSEEMLSLYKKMINNIKLNTSNVYQIKDSISEKGAVRGAYYCNYLGFVDSYRFISRVIERSGQSIFLSLFTLTNVQGEPLESGEKLSIAAEALKEVISSSLRRGDLYTRYSPNQFLILLVGISYENCNLVSSRIKNIFKEEKKVRGVRLQCSSVSGFSLGDT